MARRYSVPFSGTLTNAGGNSDLLEITPADDKPCRLVGMIIGQISEVGDTAEEGLQLSIQRLPATFTSGSGGSAVTPVPHDDADAAAGFAAECNNTTVATTSGTAVALGYIGWNIRNSPCEFYWPEKQYNVRQGSGLVVRCDTTPADDITINVTFIVEED